VLERIARIGDTRSECPTGQRRSLMRMAFGIPLGLLITFLGMLLPTHHRPIANLLMPLGMTIVVGTTALFFLALFRLL
jgi:hypothetical protein